MSADDRTGIADMLNKEVPEDNEYPRDWMASSITVFPHLKEPGCVGLTIVANEFNMTPFNFNLLGFML